MAGRKALFGSQDIDTDRDDQSESAAAERGAQKCDRPAIGREHRNRGSEVAVRIERDIDPASVPATTDEARIFVDALCPAIELVGDRAADYARGLDAPSLVADKSSRASMVLGEFKTAYPTLVICGGPDAR
jgi:hypothetical protein